MTDVSSKPYGKTQVFIPLEVTMMKSTFTYFTSIPDEIISRMFQI